MSAVNDPARVEALRRRAAACEASAHETTSADFRGCYRLLAKNYAALAQIEEEYAAGNERLASVAKRFEAAGHT